jgi:hypothetical protein
MCESSEREALLSKLRERFAEHQMNRAMELYATDVAFREAVDSGVDEMMERFRCS